MAELTKEHQVKGIGRLGGCPVCHDFDYYLNVHSNQWLVCCKHAKKWEACVRIHPSWGDVPEGDLCKNEAEVAAYETVRPWKPWEEEPKEEYTRIFDVWVPGKGRLSKSEDGNDPIAERIKEYVGDDDKRLKTLMFKAYFEASEFEEGHEEEFVRAMCENSPPIERIAAFCVARFSSRDEALKLAESLIADAKEEEAEVARLKAR